MVLKNAKNKSRLEYLQGVVQFRKPGPRMPENILVGWSEKQTPKKNRIVCGLTLVGVSGILMPVLGFLRHPNLWDVQQTGIIQLSFLASACSA